MCDIYKLPETSSNQLTDVINWIKEGKTIVIITNDYGKCRFFHNEEDEKSIYELEKFRVIVIHCKTFPGLLDDGEWNYYITGAGNKEYCSDELISKTNDAIRNKDKNVFIFVS